ncbi:MAG: putative RNA uridine N3 methyltransferase [Sulfolobales archaeon]
MEGLYVWPPPKRKVGISVVIPCSILAVEQSLYEKTILLGFLARALAIFRVDEILVYVDEECKDNNVNIITDVMEYLLTPPYLRKKTISKKETLRYVGVLPPLNISTHPSSDEGLDILPFREGVLLKVRGRYAKVDVGLGENLIAEIPVDLIKEVDLRVGSKVYVKVLRKKPLKGVLVTEREVPYYLGFKASIIKSIDPIIERLEDPMVLGVLTTKRGDDISKLVNELGNNFKDILLMFGNYRKDFDELVNSDESTTLNKLVRVRINTIPIQGVRSVRTVEALYATLALINEFIYRHGIH